MASPSERYAAARWRGRYPVLQGFGAAYPFELDDFQLEACQALEDGYGVLVCAPTGAGKTVVGEFAVELALASGSKCFYTTPIKALSNQKYHDLVRRYGASRVGLLTGDNSINGDAPVIVMTTEVLRNMLYVGSPALAGLGYVVMDEVHYLGDRFRGAVWEEVIIHLPAAVRLISLSATVSNAEEFGAWLVSLRGHTRVIVHEQRPVPLWQHVLVGRRMFDLFAADGQDGATDQAGQAQLRLNPQLQRHVRDRMARLQPRTPRRGRETGRSAARWRFRPPYRPDVVAQLDREGMLPAITFVFSRDGCDAAVQQCLHAGLWLTSEPERTRIDELITEHTAGIAEEDLAVLGYWDWRDGLLRGIAAHHAGLLPAFKETVEALFVRGLVRAVFATETLALGINMPARTVVLERLSKFNGETHADITPGEYTQLTGRAGRRGIDVDGHAVIVWTPEVDPARVAGLASTRTYPLRSSFRPSYNMAVNLVGQLGRPAARGLLESSFAQFQADRGVSELARQIERNAARSAEYAEQMRCELGEFAEYAALRRELSDRESQRSRERSGRRWAAVIASLEALHRGDVIRVPSGRRAGLAVVLDPGLHTRDDPRPLVVTERGWAGRLPAAEFTAPVSSLARLRLARNVNHRVPQVRRDLAARIGELDLPPASRHPPRRRAEPAADDDLERLRATLRAHPCHACPQREAHARWGERWARLERENEGLRRRIEGRTGSLGRRFDRICQLLEARGYLAGDQTTALGRRLARIWSESDLLVAECVREGVWDALDAAELAGAVSALVYQARREQTVVERLPGPALETAVALTRRIWRELAEQESELGLARTHEPDAGLVWACHRWARGAGLDVALAAAQRSGAQLSVGDFIRWVKQVLDLLDQLADGGGGAVAAHGLAGTARRASGLIKRGVVAQSMQA